MPSRQRGLWMWAEACEMLDRAERLHRRFFQPTQVLAQRPAWEPPIDLYETEDGYQIVVALPGADPGSVEVLMESHALTVVAERTLPVAGVPAVIHRLELPHGRFERRIELPRDPLALRRRELTNGCLVVELRKLR